MLDFFTHYLATCSGEEPMVGLLGSYQGIYHHKKEVLARPKFFLSHPNIFKVKTLANGKMADLHDDVTYDGCGKSLAAGHRECMGNSKRVLRRSISMLRGKTDRLHTLIFATKELVYS